MLSAVSHSFACDIISEVQKYDVYGREKKIVTKFCSNASASNYVCDCLTPSVGAV